MREIIVTGGTALFIAMTLGRWKHSQHRLSSMHSKCDAFQTSHELISDNNK